VSWISDTVELDAGAWLSSAYAGLGIPGYAIPRAGVSGASPIANDSISDTEEYRWRGLSAPAAGTLVLYENTSFDFYGAPDGEVEGRARFKGSGTNPVAVGATCFIDTVARENKNNPERPYVNATIVKLLSPGKGEPLKEAPAPTLIDDDESIPF